MNNHSMQVNTHEKSIDSSKSIDYYEILGVDKKATLEEIRMGYKRLLSRTCPTGVEIDKRSDQVIKAEKQLLKIASKAYDILIDPIKRQAYDEII
jgi:DnaJ-class molecular chaperone